MSTTQADAPIYAQLIRERGDVPADVRHAAERTLRDLERAMSGVPIGGFQTAPPSMFTPRG
ncbi:hypothetical protein ACWCP6_36210 [Streptomyces sp. NPDC002004]